MIKTDKTTNNLKRGMNHGMGMGLVYISPTFTNFISMSSYTFKQHQCSMLGFVSLTKSNGKSFWSY